MHTIAEKVRTADWKRWWRERDEKREECLHSTEVPEVSAMIRGAIKKALVTTPPSTGIQEVVTEQRRTLDRGSPEMKIRIAMLQRLKATFNRKHIQRALASDEEFHRIADKEDREQFLFDCWKEYWADQQMSKWEQDMRNPPPPLPLRDVMDAISLEPEMPTEYEDEPEEFEAFEHAAECYCGYGCQRISESKEGERLGLEELQSYRCRPINIVEEFEDKSTWGRAEEVEEKKRLLERMKRIGEQEKHGWKVLRRLVEDLSMEAFSESGSLCEQEKRLGELRSRLCIIEEFIVHHLPFVLSAVSVQRFCRVYLAASHERSVRESEIERIEEDQRKQRERELLAELRKYELPPGYLEALESEDSLRFLHFDRIATLEKKLSDIRLITGFNRCKTPDDYVAFFEKEVGIPDQKWRDYFWLKGGSRRPRNEGGIEKDLRCILDLIAADERFGKHAVFRDWIDGKADRRKKMLQPRTIETVEQANEIVREVCGAEGFADVRDLISDWERFLRLCQSYHGLDQAIILLSQD